MAMVGGCGTRRDRGRVRRQLGCNRNAMCVARDVRRDVVSGAVARRWLTMI